MQNHSLGSAPNYTFAALVTLGVNLFCLLLVVWTLWGYPSALVLSAGLQTALIGYERRKAR